MDQILQYEETALCSWKKTPHEAYNNLEIQIWENDVKMTESFNLISV